MEYAFLVLVLLMIIIGVASSVRRGQDTAGQRNAVESRSEILRVPVAAKYWTQRGSWSALTLRYMELVARQGALQVTPRWPRIALSKYMEGRNRQWFLTSDLTRMTVVEIPDSNTWLGRQCFIVLSQVQGGGGGRLPLVAITNAELPEVWRALESSGVTGDSPPPMS
jgi:hypothetical protein